jgi:hypothetical protein
LRAARRQIENSRGWIADKLWSSAADGLFVIYQQKGPNYGHRQIEVSRWDGPTEGGQQLLCFAW